MGFDKFRLPFGDSTFLECVVRKLLTVVDGPVIAAASKDTLAEVKLICDSMGLNRLQVIVDQRSDAGPMEGIRAGLEALETETKWAFVTSCDVPLLCPEVLDVIQAAIPNDDNGVLEAVMPVSPDRIYGMTAIYRTQVRRKVEAMVERKSLRVSDLAAELNTKEISLDELRIADPKLESMRNLNSPEQYLAFLRDHGIDCPPDVLSKLN